MRKIAKPRPGDYASYAEMYMKWLPDDGLILQHLKENFGNMRTFIYSLPEEKLSYRYLEGKWNIKEILVHIIDDERIYAYRALRFARNDQTPLPGFDQDLFTRYAGATERSLDSIFAEYEAVRLSTIAFFNAIPEEALDRKGNGTGSFAGGTPRAMLFHLAGHEQHHLHFIREHYM